MKSVLFLSHQWTGLDHPDPTLEQLRVVQRMLVRMMSGHGPTTAPEFARATYLPSRTNITPEDWAAIIPDAYIWMDFFCVPQIGQHLDGDANDMKLAIDSIPAYVARCSHFLAVVPTVRHNDLPGVTCDYGSWLERGWCRIEMWALMLSVHQNAAGKSTNVEPSAIIMKGGEASTRSRCTSHVTYYGSTHHGPTYYDSTCQASPFMCAPVWISGRPPGRGTFTCCQRNHSMPDKNGNLRTIPCDKVALGPVMWAMLKARLEIDG